MRVTRREALKGLGGLVVLAGADRTSPVVWINKHRNLTARVQRHYDVWNRRADGARPVDERWRAGFDRLREILAEAEDRAWRVRAVGSGWSLSPVAVSPDVMINTAPLNDRQVGLHADDVSSTHADPSRLVWAQCGTSIRELSASLEARGLSLPTSGASDGQTIAGAIATGTHGSARRAGSMQDYMLGLHVITDGGRHYWIERASRPVVSDAFCARFGAARLRDDRLFRAAVVSFGSFGVVHAVLFEAEPIYLLEVHRHACAWPEIAPSACSLDVDRLGLPLPGGEPFHFDVAVNPYAGAGRGSAVVTVMYKRAYRPRPAPPRAEVQLVPGVDLLGFIGAMAPAAPHLMTRMIGRLFLGSLKPIAHRPVGTHGQVFGRTNMIGRSLSMEVGCDLRDARAVVDRLIETARRHRYPGVMSLRFVGRSDALLAFTRFDTTAIVEMGAAAGPQTREFYARAWTALEASGIPFTLHWGKVNNTRQDNIRARWGPAVDDWIAARRDFLSVTGRNMFSNDMLVEAGLA